MPDINTKAELLKKAYREVDYRGKSFWIAVVEAYEKALEQEDMKERMGKPTRTISEIANDYLGKKE